MAKAMFLLFCLLVSAQNTFAAAPSEVTITIVTPGDQQNTIQWTNPGAPCTRLLMLRNTASIIDKPSDGTTYALDEYINASRVVLSAANCTTTTYTDPANSLKNGQKYYYKIFTGSATPEYSSGVQTYATPAPAGTAKGTGTIMRRTSFGDNTCGGENNACHNIKTHNSANTESTYWTSNWGTGTGSKYGKIVCQTCHQPHSTRNIYLIKPQISFPDNSAMPSGSAWSTVDYRYRSTASETSWPDANSVMGNDNAAASGRTGSSTRICEVCHSLTKFHRYNTAGQTKTDHNNAKRCTQCHDHKKGFKKGGEGGAECGACHETQANPMKGVLTNSTKTYHMVMQNSDITALSSGLGINAQYPNETQPAPGSTHRRCLYCHAEMENFSYALNAANTPGRAYNLRKSISSAPPNQTNVSQITNMDFITTQNDGGICTSCHMFAQTKDTTNRTAVDRTINTPLIDPTSFKQTTHNFYVEGGGYPAGGTQPDATTFKANCTKCHNDNLGKDYQTATYQFGLHDSPIRRLNALMNLDAKSGTAVATGGRTITVSGTWNTADFWKGRGITISSGAGSNQTRVVGSSTVSVSGIATITITASAWSPSIGPDSYYLLGDPIEEEVCFRCHSTSTTSNPNQASKKDYYNTQTFKNTRAMRMEQVFGTSNPYGHLIANYSGIHQTDEYNKAPLNATSTGWFTSFAGGNKHVGCTDCHNPHAARKPGGDKPMDVESQKGNGVPSSDSPVNSAVLSDTSKAWTTNQWRGYVLRILSGSGAGQDRLIMSNSPTSITVFTSWETVEALPSLTGPPSTNSFYVISPLGHPQYGNMLSNANDDAWGVTINGWPAAPPRDTNSMDVLTTLAGTFFTKAQKLTGNSDKIYNLCFKCHSAYGWGTGRTPFTIPDAPTATGASADIAARFNPNNLAHHAVYEKGKNQPIKANWNNSTVSSSWNTNWPIWSVAGTNSITIASGVATISTPMVTYGKEIPVLPGWFIWIGTNAANDGPHNMTLGTINSLFRGGSTWGWFEITAITSLSRFTVTPAVSVSATSVFAITAGLGNNFIPPYGPWSVVSCADCHDTDSSSDPSGPHASARKWILRKMEIQDFPWFNGRSVIRKRYVPPNVRAWAAASTDGQNLVCVNCHRADVYGIDDNDPQNTAGPAADASGRYFINMTWVAGKKPLSAMSRQVHAIENGNASGSGNNVFNMYCMQCHAGSELGQIHGTNVGYSRSSTNVAVLTGHYRGKRFLTGGAWRGVERGSPSRIGRCAYEATPYSQNFNTCGGSGTWANFSAGIANYDYESGSDF